MQQLHNYVSCIFIDFFLLRHCGTFYKHLFLSRLNVITKIGDTKGNWNCSQYQIN